MTDRRFVFFAVLMIIIGIELFTLRFMINSDPNYGQKLINIETENYIKIAGIESTDRIYKAVSNIKDFVYQAVKGKKELFNMLMNTIGVPVITGLIRALTLLYAIPLIVAGVVLGFAEGYITQKRKIEKFQFYSPFIFHWTHRFSIFFYACLLIGYLLFPSPTNPFLILYGYGFITYTLVYNSVANLPLGRL